MNKTNLGGLWEEHQVVHEVETLVDHVKDLFVRERYQDKLEGQLKWSTHESVEECSSLPSWKSAKMANLINADETNDFIR
jgi:hypothetical protein